MVKAEHQRPHGKLHPLEVPMWKWEQITMELITKLPWTDKGFDAIWVIVVRLTKSALFLAIQKNSSAEKLTDVYVSEIIARHGVTVSIVSKQVVMFTSSFYQRFYEELGTRLHFNTTYHLQTANQRERTIQILEDML